MDTIFEILKKFKIPLIIAGAVVVLLLVVNNIYPILKDANDHKTPIVEIIAENSKVYEPTEEILIDDFIITAIHEDGKRTDVALSDVELSKTSINITGDTTTVTIIYKPDTSIYCNVDVKSRREKIIGFQCGYPDVKNVIAVLYSNGELCFEGKGDTLTFPEGGYPWQNYEESSEYPIKSVTFESGVTPRVMDYWFENIYTIEYVDPIPESVQSMKWTFSGCTWLTTIADWTNCKNLLDITGIYNGCVSLKYTYEVPSGITKASSAFAGCVRLQKTPNLANATSLRTAHGMFQECTKLVSITMPPNVTNITNMFASCINLQIMPSIPESVLYMDGTFQGCTALKTLSTIPYNVYSISNCFANCEFIEGTCTINANPEDLNGAFSGACVATSLDLNGSSLILDAFANTHEYYNITVNGKDPIPEIKSYEDYKEYKRQMEDTEE